MQRSCAWTRLAAAALLAPLAFAQADLSRYLEQNRQALDLAHFDAKLLDLRDKQILLFGESHGVAVNEDLDLALLQYLHREAGVRVYLAEIGYAAGFALNQYLQTGDEKILDYVMAQSKGSVSWTKERRAFYVRVRQWNSALPPADRIVFAGVDVEHQQGLAVRMLTALAAGTPPPDIADAVAKLRAGDAAGLAANLAAHRADYQQMLGTRFFDFELIAENLQKAMDYYAAHDSPKGQAIREQVMYDTFRKLYARAGGGRWYGRWGSFHVPQQPDRDRDRFANMLNRADSPVAGKVAGIVTLYENSEAVLANGSTFKIEQTEEPVALFAAAAAGPITLFRLDAADSPFRKPVAKLAAGRPVAQITQYIMLIRNGAASHPLEEAGAATFANLPPVVVRSVPEAGSRNVPADLSEVRVTFSKEMKDKSWSWCIATPFEFPPLSNVHYDADRRTIVAAAKLAPGKKYAVWLNTDGCSSFRDAQGHSAVPYLLTFETEPRP